MNEVYVTFLGVCTHITGTAMTAPDDALIPPPHPRRAHYSRVVLVTARFGSRLANQPIPPHFQLLYIPAEFIDEAPDEIPGLENVDDPFGRWWSLEGVRLYVAGAHPGLSRTQDFDRLPGLTDSSNELSLQLDERVVADGRAACEFEIYGGTLDAYQLPDVGPALVGKLTVQTQNDTAQLVVTRVWDQTTTRIKLKAGAHLYIMNIGEDTDRETDFLLHYFVTTWTPREGHIPRPVINPAIRPVMPHDEIHRLGKLPQGLTLGCSNSNYP